MIGREISIDKPNWLRKKMEDGEKGEDHDVFVVIYPSTGLST